MNIKTFNYFDFNFDSLKNSFKENSVIQINNLFSKELCTESAKFILKNEKKIINKYSKDSRGLVKEKINNNEFIKYFDKPLEYEFNIFSKFINSKIFNLSKVLLNEDVYLDRFEIHSRFPQCSPIPPHQDNAYFGLKKGMSITFYISLNKQLPEEGGLRYYKIPIGSKKEHITSDYGGFSLTTKKVNFKELKIFNPKYEAGDCTIHHSTNIHFADKVPKSSERVFALSLRMHAISDFVKDSHKKNYEQIVKRNRNEPSLKKN